MTNEGYKFQCDVGLGTKITRKTFVFNCVGVGRTRHWVYGPGNLKKGNEPLNLQVSRQAPHRKSMTGGQDDTQSAVATWSRGVCTSINPLVHYTCAATIARA